MQQTRLKTNTEQRCVEKAERDNEEGSVSVLWMQSQTSEYINHRRVTR